jgi:glycosyltransferase 2 family protein
VIFTVADRRDPQVSSVSEEELARPRVTPWKWLLAIALACVLPYFALRGVEWKRVGSIVAHASIGYLALAGLCGTLAYLVRTLRWRVLLNAQEKLSYTTVLWASSVGYLANNYLVTGSGELLRTGMITSRSRLSKTYVFTTAMTERVVEFLTLALMASLLSLTLAHRPPWLRHLIPLVALGAVSGVVILSLLPRIDRARMRLVARVPIPAPMKARLHRLAEHVSVALGVLRNFPRATEFFALAILVWVLDAAAGVTVARALSLRLSFGVCLLLFTAMFLGSTMSAVPGALGAFQFAAVGILVPFGYSKTDAITFILADVALAYLIVTSLGLIGLWRCHKH